MKLCPFSFGLALGITGALGVLIGSFWIMYHGVPPMMVQLHMPVPTYKDAAIHALGTLLKGFVFGFFVALFYDLISGCCKKCICCKKSDESCKCCGSSDKSEAAK
jgi:hypothetical protein